MLKKYASILFLLIPFFAFSQPHSIILGRPTDTSMTASILYESSQEFYLEWGTQNNNFPFQSIHFIPTRGVPMEIDIRNLVPNTRYFYRVQSKVNNTFQPSPTYSFITARQRGSTYSFTIEADEHLYDIKGVGNLYNITLANQAADNPDFMLSLGDIFGDDHYPNTITSGELDTLHKYYRPYLGRVCHSIPFYVCLGNHEGENDYYLSRNPPNN